MIEHVWLEHGVVRWHIGIVSGPQYLQSNAQLREDARFECVRYVIDDFLDCSALLDTDPSVLGLSGPSGPSGPSVWAEMPADLRHAIVSSSAALRERAYRMASKCMGSPAVMKFSDMGKAREWARGDAPDLPGAFRQWPGLMCVGPSVPAAARPRFACAA